MGEGVSIEPINFRTKTFCLPLGPFIQNLPTEKKSVNDRATEWNVVQRSRTSRVASLQ